MGTRNMTFVQVDGEYKIAQYGQWDGYPSGQGVTILNFLHLADLDKFKEIVRKVREITQDEWDDIIKNHTDNGQGSIVYGGVHEKYWDKYLKHFSRDLGGEILWHVYQGKTDVVKDDTDFVHDGLFCEYAYVVDLDKNTFEVFEGFNKEPNKPTDRFYAPEKNSSETYNDGDGKEYKYHSARCIKVYDLNDLPTVEEFEEYFEKLYEDEE